jgi:hypothetical protein
VVSAQEPLRNTGASQRTRKISLVVHNDNIPSTGEPSTRRVLLVPDSDDEDDDWSIPAVLTPQPSRPRQSRPADDDDKYVPEDAQ